MSFLGGEEDLVCLFERRVGALDEQVVLQTWHGSMFKRIGLDRPGFDPIQERALKKERDKWDLLLSQNRHSSEIFRSAYAWEGPILEEGYPRNDALAGGDGRPIRELLGIPLDDTVVLYAPTWRDDQTKAELLLDVAALAAELGAGYTLLLRGHTRTHEISEAVTAEHLLDVTTYPDITELFLASDILITDYSSVIYEYSLLGRPMLFFSYDRDVYAATRGFHRDFEETAPGKACDTFDELLTAIADSDFETWRIDQFVKENFDHVDTGSTDRVIDWLILGEPPQLQPVTDEQEPS